jgi:hypothetical protein
VIEPKFTKGFATAPEGLQMTVRPKLTNLPRLKARLDALPMPPTPPARCFWT